MHARLDNELRAAFAGEARQRWGQSLHEAIDRDSDGQHVVVTAGGVSAFTVETEQILGDSAELTGRATSWITWIILDPGYPGPRAGHPSDEIAFQARLTRMDGQWQVVELSLERIGA
jgi:hypothetical protein